MEIIIASSAFLLIIFVGLVYFGAGWSSNISNFLFANRSLQAVSSTLSITSHWFWAIAIFVGPAIAYTWGWQGLLWFAIPNGLSCWIVGYLAYRVRDSYPDGYSLTEYTKDNFLNPYRRKNKYNMETTSQVMYDLNDLVFYLRWDIDHSEFKGVVEKLPENYKPKIKIDIQETD